MALDTVLRGFESHKAAIFTLLIVTFDYLTPQTCFSICELSSREAIFSA